MQKNRFKNKLLQQQFVINCILPKKNLVIHKTSCWIRIWLNYTVENIRRESRARRAADSGLCPRKWSIIMKRLHMTVWLPFQFHKRMSISYLYCFLLLVFFSDRVNNFGGKNSPINGNYKFNVNWIMLMKLWYLLSETIKYY